MFDWLFRKKLRPGQKLALYSLSDFPRDRYYVYPEIAIQNNEPFKWRARMLSWATSAVLAEETGTEVDENTARRKSQEWVLSQFPLFDRLHVQLVDPLPPIDRILA